jgi:hypothetical protein
VAANIHSTSSSGAVVNENEGTIKFPIQAQLTAKQRGKKFENLDVWL